MDDEAVVLPVLKITEQGRNEVDDIVIKEFLMKLRLRPQEED